LVPPLRENIRRMNLLHQRGQHMRTRKHLISYKRRLWLYERKTLC